VTSRRLLDSGTPARILLRGNSTGRRSRRAEVKVAEPYEPPSVILSRPTARCADLDRNDRPSPGASRHPLTACGARGNMYEHRDLLPFSPHAGRRCPKGG